LNIHHKVTDMQRTLLLSAAAIGLIALVACSQQPAQTQPAPAQAASSANSPFRLTATILDLMDSEVDPSADYLWDSVGYIATKAGKDDRQPRTDADWAVAKHNAMTLVEATNLLVMEGRQVAAPGQTLDATESAGISSPDEIQKAIDSSRDTYIGLAHGLHDAGMEMLKAVEARNVAGMTEAGEKLDSACEACHRTYWYPNAPEPTKVFDEKNTVPVRRPAPPPTATRAPAARGR
jgi:hypothetical protein